jgi:hypothetical protein
MIAYKKVEVAPIRINFMSGICYWWYLSQKRDEHLLYNPVKNLSITWSSSG